MTRSFRAPVRPGLNKLAENRIDALPRIRLYLWPHRLLLLGPGFDTGLHRHHAAQICFGLYGPLRLRTSSDGPWDEHGGFYVPPDRPHEFAAATTPTAIIYIEAESAEFGALRRSLHVGDGVVRFEPETTNFARLRRLATTGGTIAQAEAVCLSMLGLESGHEQHRALDPRIEQCLTLIRARLDQPLRLAGLAAALDVSSSWLGHCFTHEVGVPMRRYVLWQRLWRAVEAALNGATLTEAAHAVGLSDSAHLSRTFRNTFGVAPSFLFDHREQLAVSFSEG